MKRLIYAIALLSLSGITSAQESTTFSLNEAIAYAQRNHSNIKRSELDIQFAKAQVKEYTAIGIPKLNGGVEYNYYAQLPTSLIPADAFAFPGAPPPQEKYIEAQFGTRNNLTFSLTLSTLVFDGSYFVGLKASKGLLDLTKRQADLSKYQVKDLVVKAYLTVLIANENRAVLQNNIDNLTKMRNETQAYYKNGLVEKLDVDRLDLSMANLKTEMEALDRQVDLAYNVLKFQMNFPLNESIVVSDSLHNLLTEPSESDLEGDVALQRIEMDLLQQNIHLNELNTKRYTMGYLPSLSAFAAHQQTLQRDNLFDSDAPGFFPTTIIGLKLDVPIFDGFHKTSKIQQSKVDVLKFKLQLDDFKRAANLEVLNAREIYKNAKMRLDNQDKNLVLAEQILETTRIKYREGVGSSLEMTQAEQELYSTQANRLNALYELVLAKSDLDKALGK